MTRFDSMKERERENISYFCKHFHMIQMFSNFSYISTFLTFVYLCSNDTSMHNQCVCPCVCLSECPHFLLLVSFEFFLVLKSFDVVSKFSGKSQGCFKNFKGVSSKIAGRLK